MKKRVLLLSLASISCIPTISQLCSNYNSHNISINQVNGIQTNINLSNLNNVDISEIAESTEYDDEMPNYSAAKDSWNEKMNDQEHKTFQKFNLYANELSSLNLSLNSDKDKIIKEGNDCLEYAQDNNMNLGKFKTFISEVYKPQEQLEQNPQLSKFSSIFKGHKDDDTGDIKDKIAEFKDYSISMTKLFASISGGLVVLEVVLIVICLVWKNKPIISKDAYNTFKPIIPNLKNELTRLNNKKDILFSFANRNADYFKNYSDKSFSDDITQIAECYNIHIDITKIYWWKKLSENFVGVSNEVIEKICKTLFYNNSNYDITLRQFFNHSKNLFSKPEDFFNEYRNDFFHEEIEATDQIIRNNNQTIELYEKITKEYEIYTILLFTITWIAPMILETIMVTIIYPTFFYKTCNKLLSQNKSNYDRNEFHEIEKSIEIAKTTVIVVTTVISIASLIANFATIILVASSPWVKVLFSFLNIASATGIAMISTYVYKDIEKIEDLSKKYQAKLEKK